MNSKEHQPFLTYCKLFVFLWHLLQESLNWPWPLPLKSQSKYNKEEISSPVFGEMRQCLDNVSSSARLWLPDQPITSRCQPPAMRWVVKKV